MRVSKTAKLSMRENCHIKAVPVQSINFNACIMHGQFEGGLCLRARFNSTDQATKPRHIVKLDRKILMQEVLVWSIVVRANNYKWQNKTLKTNKR